MKKLLCKLLGVKIIKIGDYNLLKNSVTETAKLYKEAAGDNSHNFNTAADIKLEALSIICIAENVLTNIE